jgi:hypothetical protein
MKSDIGAWSWHFKLDGLWLIYKFIYIYIYFFSGYHYLFDDALLC